jgi:hypothetical protein
VERRFRVRLDEVLADAVVEPVLLRGMLSRLECFLEPFVASLATAARRRQARPYVAGLVSDLDRKNAAGIASLHDQERQGLQQFLGQAPGDERALVPELARQVGAALGEPDGVLVFDPSAFPQQGNASVGVQRPGCGRLGQVDNGQVGVYLGYGTRLEQVLVACRLDLPQEWATDNGRRTKAGVPQAVRFHTRPERALGLLDAHGPAWPHTGGTGDDERGRSSWFRAQRRQRGERYRLAVPSNTAVRDLAAAPPPYQGQGRHPKVAFTRVERWWATLPEAAGPTIEVRDDAKGPLVVQAAWGLVPARTEGKVADVAAVVVVFREHQADGTCQHDDLLTNAALTTPLAE